MTAVKPRFGTPCVYQADPDTPADADGNQPCICHMPKKHTRHQLPDVHDEQAAHRARTGDKEDDR